VLYQIEVIKKRPEYDAEGKTLRADIADLGVKQVSSVRVVTVYSIETEENRASVELLARELLSDPIAERFYVDAHPPEESAPNTHVVLVARKPGVMDPVEGTVLRGMADLGLSARTVRTARKFLIEGELSEAQLRLIASKILANEVIEDVFFDRTKLGRIAPPRKYQFELLRVPLSAATDEGLMRISREGGLSLSLCEMKAIQQHFASLGKEPTDIELETIAQTWSEHCVHKTFRGPVDFDGEKIANLLKETIVRATREIDKPWCISVFEDNAGIIEFDERYGVCFKVETHNHPSAIEPYGGAGTGTGGVIRDPLGTGLGAKPVLCTDVFCFAPPDYPHEKLPPGVLHPRRLLKGVVAGVRDYGNRMGIPTANGALYFDERYLGNPLVYCGNVGLIPRAMCRKEPKAGDLILLVGGRTGRDGIHGATFSSKELSSDSERVSSGAVQIGNPIMEKKLVDTILQARDLGLYDCITDCGGGGLSSAVGEMGKDLGVEVHLERVPLKYEGLSYTEIWISEAQERMILSVPPGKIADALAVFAAEDVEATVIGSFTGDRRLKLYYGSNLVCDLDMGFLHGGLPRVERKATWKPPSHPEPALPEKPDYGDDLEKLLASWNVCSKEWVIRQYDHEVQGGVIVKPLQGRDAGGPGDACVFKPLLDSPKGVIVACGMNPKYGDIDPYWMAAAAIDEAIRQVIASGGELERIALLDNFSWGRTDRPEILGALVRAAKACYDIATAYGTPFISGKDSLNNEFQTDQGPIVIPHSLLISAIAVMDDASRAVTMDFKEPGNLIYAVGLTKRELGGSHYYSLAGQIGNEVPRVEPALGRKVFESLGIATKAGLVRACHDCSEGGIAVALAEMAFAGGLGAEVDLSLVPAAKDANRDDVILFSESNSRFIVEVRPDRRNAFEDALRTVPLGCIGVVADSTKLRIRGLRAETVVDEEISALRDAWRKPLQL